MYSTEINNILSDWNEEGVQYCLFRGWNGTEIVGSDIDILVSNRSFQELKTILFNKGFVENSRGLLFVDFFANELYFDKYYDDTKIRFHVTDTIVFGKPTRKVRFPYEETILNEAEYDTCLNANVPTRPHTAVIDIMRTLIDKPHRLLERDSVYSEALIRDSNFDCQDVLLELLSIYYAGFEREISPKQAQSNALKILKNLEKSQYRRRKVQRLYAEVLISGYRSTIKQLR